MEWLSPEKCPNLILTKSSSGINLNDLELIKNFVKLLI